MKSLVAALAALTAVLLVSSCSKPAGGPAADGHGDHQHGAPSSSTAGAPSNSAAPRADFNDADVTFATMMIPHHQQAVTLSAMVPQRSSNPKVVALAADISKAQAPEIATMQGFLREWNGDESAGHQGHDMSHMQGMVDAATMDRLNTLTGAPFDTLWLQSMIGHHEGAVGMAQTESKDGTNAAAKQLAQQIITSQNAEVTQMKQMLGA